MTLPVVAQTLAALALALAGASAVSFCASAPRTVTVRATRRRD
jgi:hypothetical protein